MKLPIYMDNHATTPVDPRVLEAITPYFVEIYGNASSHSHSFGWQAQEAVEKARKLVADLMGAKPSEIIFTSGATESNNLSVKGIAEKYRERGNHIITAATEHKAVLDPCKRLEKNGFQVTVLPVDRCGLIDPDDVCRAITDRTVLITIMLANNEIGTVHAIAEIGQIAHEKGVLFHSDAAQALGKVPVDVGRMRIDLLSCTAHKLYGPKGIGALYIQSEDPPVTLSPLFDGGGQEWGLRSGTLNVPGIVGFGKACQLAREEMPAESERLRQLRDKLQDGIFSELDEVYLNGHPTKRLPHNLNVSVGYVEGEALLMSLSDIAVSSGSACRSACIEPSHVLTAIGVNAELAQSSIRFGLGRFNAEEEVNYVKERVVEAVRRLRELSPLYEAARAGTPQKPSQ